MQWMKNDRSLFLSSCNSLVWGVPDWPTVLLPSLSHFGALFGMWFLLIQWVGSSKGGSSGSQISFTTNQAKLALSFWRSLDMTCKGLGGLSIAGAPQSYLQLWLWKMAWLWWSLRSPCEVGFLKGHFFPLCVLIVPRAWLMDFDFFCL